MALSGIQIYKLLPQTNCKECGFPTCLAFAMKLAAKQVELGDCPYVSDEAKEQLAESSAPPVRLITLKADGTEVKSGNEVVLFRHEKTFYHKPGLFVRVKDTDDQAAVEEKVKAADTYVVDYVGMDLKLDGIAVEAAGGDFPGMIETVRANTSLPLILIGDGAALAQGVEKIEGESALLVPTGDADYAGLAALAKGKGMSLAVSGSTLDELADLTQTVTDVGLEDIVLYPQADNMGQLLTLNTQIRRLALKKNFRPLGFPILNVPAEAGDPAREITLAAQAITKYGGFIVIDQYADEVVYPLLVLRENIYTDPQKPIQVQPGIYEINNPGPNDPVLSTTNFSITYFSVANEVEGSGMPAWLLVADAEGMSVLTAWAAGKYDAERIAKGAKEHNIADKVEKKVIVLPGHVAVLSGELEEELPGWDVKVGPREAVDLPMYLKEAL